MIFEKNKLIFVVQMAKRYFRAVIRLPRIQAAAKTKITSLSSAFPNTCIFLHHSLFMCLGSAPHLYNFISSLHIQTKKERKEFLSHPINHEFVQENSHVSAEATSLGSNCFCNSDHVHQPGLCSSLQHEVRGQIHKLPDIQVSLRHQTWSCRCYTRCSI